MISGSANPNVHYTERYKLLIPFEASDRAENSKKLSDYMFIYYFNQA
jgi:hypothetical protein